MKPCMIYMTAGSPEEARAIGKALVSERLAACVNIIEGMNSLYWWKGEVQEDNEVVVIAKTRQSLVPELSERVKEIHGYDCPCVVALPITDGFQPFLDWISEETKKGMA
ncbi:MAG: divalent-cation tolerance protein CutA [Deltaproteobacteria bacterium]|nr:divalent-cation tolerance protein CutA [Deltaproteobacteria bacterium]MBW2285979.1 divalent-cation tolerance protein CutA [Deltaproteobacteria bacterium]